MFKFTPVQPADHQVLGRSRDHLVELAAVLRAVRLVREHNAQPCAGVNDGTVSTCVQTCARTT